MVKILLVADRKENLAGLDAGLKKNSTVDIQWALSSNEAFDNVSGKELGLVVVDDTLEGTSGLKIIEKMVKINPMTNYAAVSSLSAHDFHEESEGLGVLMQLPEKPDEDHGNQLMGKLNKVLSLTSAG